MLAVLEAAGGSAQALRQVHRLLLLQRSHVQFDQLALVVLGTHNLLRLATAVSVKALGVLVLQQVLI